MAKRNSIDSIWHGTRSCKRELIAVMPVLL